MDASILLEKVSQTLSALPDVELCSVVPEAFSRDTGVEYQFRVKVHGRAVLLLAQIKKGGYPRDVRAAAWRLNMLQKVSGQIPTIPMLISPVLSETSRSFLQEQNLAYCDANGSVYLKLPWAMILIDRPRQEAEKRLTRNLFRGASAQVLHLLLTDPERPWQVLEVANRAGVAQSTAHQVLSTLEKELILESTGKGPNLVRRLCDPGALLTSWAEAHSLAVYNQRSYYRWTQSPAQLRSLVTKELDLRQIPNALTLTSGAELSAPHTTGVDQLSILLAQSTPIDEVAATLELKPVTDGANITFLLTKEKAPYMFRRLIDDVWVATDIQLYLDLYSLPARGREQAAHLRRERLSFLDKR